MGCLVEPDRVADVGSQSIGVLERVYVERGDEVAAGQLVARLSAGVEKASASVAEARSQSDAELRQAMAASDLAQRKLNRARDLLKREFVSDQAVEQAEAEARVAEQRVAQARESQRVTLREFQLSSVQLGQRDVRSPFSGIVVERFRTEGERIERDPLIRVAKIDPLRIEAIVPAAQFGSIAAGQVATIKTDLPNFSAMSAKVVLVDRVIDPASNSFRVRLMLPNPDHKIPSGLRCKVDFAVADGAARAASAGAAAASMRPRLPASAPVPASAPDVSARGVLLNKAAQAKPLAATVVPVTATPAAKAPLANVAPAKPPVIKTPIAMASPATAPSALPAPLALSLPSTRLVVANKAPERLLVKQYIASREPRLSMSKVIASPHPASLGNERIWLTQR